MQRDEYDEEAGLHEPREPLDFEVPPNPVTDDDFDSLPFADLDQFALADAAAEARWHRVENPDG